MNDWFEAEQRVERAYQLAESRQWGEALSELDAALDINPTNGAWQAQRGYLLDQLERFEDAIDAYRAAMSLDPGEVEVLVALGVDLTRLGRSTEAVEVLADAARLAPDLEPAYCYRILAHTDLGEHEQAEEMFYLAQQITEECPHCFFHMGGSLATRGLYDRAIYCWGRTLDIDPLYPGVRHAIAEAYREQNNPDRAREYYLAELRQDPGNVDLLFDMAELELEAGQPAKSAAKLRQIVELDPDFGQAHFALGEVLLELDEAHEALECLRTAADLDPEIPRLHLRIGQALMQVSEFSDAVRHLAAAALEEPEDESVLLAWGNCLLRLGRGLEAADKFRRLIKVDVTNADAHHNLGVCYFLDGAYAEGLDHILRAIELNPRDLAALHKAVVVLMHLNRWHDARAMIDQALAIDANDPALRQLRDRFWRHRIQATIRRIAAAVQQLAQRGQAVFARLRK